MRLFPYNNKFKTIDREYRTLLHQHQMLTAEYQTLLDRHRVLEQEKRNADVEISALSEELEFTRSKYVHALRDADFLMVGTILIEAPFPLIPHDIRDALAAEQYESAELYLGRKLVRPGETVLDLGSGLGLTAITAAISSQGGRVVGYEADPRIAELAQRNARYNRTDVEIRSSAIAAKAGFFTLYQAPLFLSNSAVPFEGGAPLTVPCAAINDVIAEVKPAVIICDIEGLERDLFENADLSAVQRIVIETHETLVGPEGVDKCVRSLEAQGSKVVTALCWGPVLVFDGDGSIADIQPYTVAAPADPQTDMNEIQLVGARPLKPRNIAWPVNFPENLEAIARFSFFEEFRRRDDLDIPAVDDREGYNPGEDYIYWMSGLADYQIISSRLSNQFIGDISVLDFGGCSGRVARHFLTARPGDQITIAETNANYVEWVNRRNNSRLNAVKIGPRPELPFDDAVFDFAFGISVFTHIDDDELEWLKELTRVVKPHHYIYLTILSEISWRSMAPQTLFNVVKGESYPDYAAAIGEEMPSDRLSVALEYGGKVNNSNTFHSEKYIRDTWARFATVEQILHNSHGDQAAVILKTFAKHDGV